MPRRASVQSPQSPQTQRGTAHRTAKFAPSTVVDFVVVGSGAAGGIIAKELSTRGFKVVVLEQGPRIESGDFQHDEFKHGYLNYYNNKFDTQPQSFKAGPDGTPQPRIAAAYHRLVGGGSLCFTANYRRLRPLDFDEASRIGPMAGTTFADWPITYNDLEPYYTKAEWEIGVSGEPGPFDPPRSRPYPMPPLPVKSSGVLFERGARAIGLHPQAAQMSILSRPYHGRPPCQQCGYCIGFPCEHRAKGSKHVVIPMAEATGRCEIRTGCVVGRVEMDSRGRATGVMYFDDTKTQQLQRARAVVLCCNGAETPHLLLNSATPQFSNGLANSSGMVGHNLMFNSNAVVNAQFEHELDDWKGAMVTRIALDFYDNDPLRGFYGGGALDGRFFGSAPFQYAMGGPPPGTPRWGPDYKRALRDGYRNQMNVLAEGTSLPLDTNRIELDPDLKDIWGLPAMRVTYMDHNDDLALMKFLQGYANDLLNAAGARKVWSRPPGPQGNGVHLLGTCRMGNDPAKSVVDKYHRTHDVKNLFLCDGSSMVTSGRGQPTCTIQALAYRAGANIARFARRAEI
ncbi:MAG TPA: GMC family oxidoreductase [Gemmatimonadales bacterium]|jgi:choline dehydrogenase-like flavoprotein